MSQVPSIRRLGQAIVRAWLLLAMVAIVTAIALAGVSRVPARYSARVTLRIATAGALSGEVVRAEDGSYVERLQNTYSALATSRPLRTAVMRRLQLSERPAVVASGRPSSELMDLTVTTGSAASAAAAADATGALLIDKVRELDTANFNATDATAQAAIRALQAEIETARAEREALSQAALSDSVKAQLLEVDADIALKTGTLAEQQAGYQRIRSLHPERATVLSVVTPAVVPISPSSPPERTTVLAGAVLIGLAGGLSLIALLERARERVVYPDEAQRAAPGLRVLAPLAYRARRMGIVPAEGAAADGFRHLRTELLLMADRGTFRSVLVTSPKGTTGAGWVAANLACAFARAGHPCAVVDAAVKAPSLHRSFDVDGHRGIADVLRETASLDSVVAETSEPDLHLVPAGDPAAGTRDALTPARVAKVVAALEGTFELTVVHAPSPTVDADAASFAAVAGCVLLVVRAEETTRTAISETCERLAGVNAPMAGIVFLSRKGGR